MNDATQLNALAVRLAAGALAVDGAASRAVRASAASVESHAKQRAPVDTGFLRGSIHTTTPGPLVATIGPSAEYGAHVEFGTSRMAGQPYMRPALDSEAPRLAAAMAAVGTSVMGAVRL